MKDLIYAIIDTASAINAAGTRLLKPLGLTPMTYNILNVLDGSELSQRELSDRLIVVASSITFQVRQLQRRGLIKRRRQDRRTWLVSLTSKGKDLLQVATSGMEAWIARLQIPTAEADVARQTVASLKTQISSRSASSTHIMAHSI